MTGRKAARELIARAIHERYRQNQQGNKAPDDPAMQSWEDLAETLRESNRQQADDIAAKLRRLGYGIQAVTGHKPVEVAFTEKELELMAEMEHERWTTERKHAGWQLGAERNPEHKISPHLVPWAELPDAVREWDRQAVRAIPEVLAQAKLEVYRLYQCPDRSHLDFQSCTTANQSSSTRL